MLKFPVFLGIILSATIAVTHGRSAEKPEKTLGVSTISQRNADAESIEELNSDEGVNKKANGASNGKFRLDFYSDGSDESPFASYQFENEKKAQSSTTVSSSSTVSGVPHPTLASSANNVIHNTTIEEDETDLLVSTTPFKVDSLGNVVTINNNEDNESSEEQCDEGEVKKVKCNTCVCTDGVFFCSKKPCPEKVDEEPSDNNNNEEDEQRHDIFSDDAAIEQIMNKVSVGAFGSSSPGGNAGVKNKWSWKKKHPVPNPLPDCTNGMTKAIDCNNCICAGGKWACTKTSCIALTLREKASYTDGTVIKKVDALKENHHLDEDCLEGSTREANCNQCVCHYNSWSCTNRPCSSTTPRPKMKEIEEACQLEGDVKSKDCNLCKCKRGVWVCTTNNCMVFGIATIPYNPPKFRASPKVTKP